jgi:uncharacterized SAM-binding protein YcdF (DUF218 family)
VRKKTAAVAVGIGVHPNGKRASRRSAANAIVAANLREVGLASHVVLLSLNAHASGLNEAEAMRLEISGCPDVILDPRQLASGDVDNTFRNMLSLRELVLEYGWERVIICAHKHHAFRAGMTARWALRGLGVEVVVLYVPGEYDPEATGKYETARSFWRREVLVWIYAILYFIWNWNLPLRQ